MKNLALQAFAVLFALQLAMNMNAQKTTLLDRDLFFGNPEISGGQLSPDGQWISFLKEYEGIMNIWVKKFDEPFSAARPLTNSKRPLYGYFWTVDGKYILYVKDKDGDENINVFAVDPFVNTAQGQVPESRNLTPRDEVTARIYNVSDNNPDLLMIGLNDRDKAWHDLYQLSIATGKLDLVYENNDRITGYNFDWDDKLRLLYKTDEKGSTTIFYKEGDKLTPIYDFSVTEGAGVIAWNEDNTKFYLETNKGDLDLSTLFLMDPKTQQMTKIASDPLNRVDFGNLSIDRNTRKIISISYTDDKTRIYWQNKEWEANYKFLQKKFPGREIGFGSSTKDYSKFLVTVYGDRYASEAYFFNPKTKELIFQYTPRPKLKEVEKNLSEMKAITYKSSDGLEIPAFLTLPKGMKAKNLPVVVLVHGGPKGPRDYWGYDAEVQFLANRGYAVLQPNFRASGGYGKKFLNAGDLQWGKLMQDDITWGVKYLIDNKIADPKRVAIMGGSYGGYATLAGLAFTPEVYAAGVDIVGPSNIFTLLESVPAYWEAGRAFLYGMVGDPNTPEGEKLIREASPLFSADKITKPLMIIQGANDPRVKKAEADQIAIALRDKGKQVSYLLAADEGHGFSKPLNKMAMYAEVEKFLAGVLGGRYQADMPADVAQTLEKLKVDISKVTYEAPKAVSVAKALPALNCNFSESKISYKVNIQVQGQELPMTTERTISKNNNQWVVSDLSNSPALGQIKDEITYTAEFKPVNRSIAQMGQNFSMDFSDQGIELSAMGQKMNIAMEAAYMSDGAGMDLLVGGLPLANGYSISLMMPDMATMKGKTMNLKVEGVESIQGQPCWKVTIINAENEVDRMTLWIDQKTKTMQKMEQVNPAMGNAIITTEKV